MREHTIQRTMNPDNILNEYYSIFEDDTRNQSDCDAFLIESLRSGSNNRTCLATAMFRQLIEISLRLHPETDELLVKWCMGVALFWTKTPVPENLPDNLLQALSFDFYDLTHRLKCAYNEAISPTDKMVQLYEKLSNQPEVRNRIEFDYGAYHRSRAGLRWRDEDENITLEKFEQRFGFSCVYFGGFKQNDRDKQELLNLAYDALNDLCAVLGVPPHYVSFNGELSIGFGLKGSSNAAAQYEPGRKLLNMSRARYGGTLAHEWFHAFDDHFGNGDRFASEFPRNQIWTDFINSLCTTGYFKRCKGFSSLQGDDYWNKTVEKCARGFETYVWTEMKKRGWCNNYLVSRIKPWKDEDNSTFPYPFEDEQEVFIIYEKLIKNTIDGIR